MGNKQWYETLFENYSRGYDNESFTQGTVGECDFIERETVGDRSLKILDIGCGTGRHAIELARRGFKVVGIDLSESQLARAREKASAAGLEIDFRRQDARKLLFKEEFDLAIMLCEGAFSLMETDEMNFEILRGAADALKTGGKLIFTALNALFPLFHSVEKFCAATAAGQNAAYKGNSFDLMTFRDHCVTTFLDDDGNSKELASNERYYAPSEIAWLLKSAGFENIGIYGAKLGAFSRESKLTKDDFEMLATAEKKQPTTVSSRPASAPAA